MSINNEIDEDDEVEIKLSPNGSVLMPSANPYDKYQRIWDANEALRTEDSRDKSSNRVTFNEEVIILEEEIIDEEDLDPDQIDVDDCMDKNSTVTYNDNNENSNIPSKILHVTVPGCFNRESEDTVTDDELENEIEENDDNKNMYAEQESNNEIKESGSESEEEIEDETVPFHERTSPLPEDITAPNEGNDEHFVNEDLSVFLKKSATIGDQSDEENEISLNNNGRSEKAIINKKKVGSKKNKQLVIRPSTSYSKSGKFNDQFNRNGIRSNLNWDDSNKRKDKKVRFSTKGPFEIRPSTAPVKRTCCKESKKIRLPSYNGLRSEYGLTQQQFNEREKKKMEYSKALRLEKEKKYLEERQKQKENDMKFNNWLVRKKREAAENTLRKLKQSNNYYFRTTIPAPTVHLEKIGVLRKQLLRREKACFFMDELFKNTKPQEERTYRIYLGLTIE